MEGPTQHDNTTKCGASKTVTARRQQRRPDLQASFRFPDDLIRSFTEVSQQLEKVAASCGPLPPSGAALISLTNQILAELQTSCLTPERQLLTISKLTSALREPETACLVHPGGVLQEWGHSLTTEFLLPLLLDCRVRYLHRTLMTLLRTVAPSPTSELEAAVKQLYCSRLLSRRLPSEVSAKATQSSLYFSPPPATSATCAQGLPAVENGDGTAEHNREWVMDFLNSIDGLTSTLIPMVPGVFQSTFLDALPLLADCFEWVVMTALQQSRRQNDCLEESESTNSGGDRAVFCEDLDRIRFCVRVVATYTHKYMDCLTEKLSGPTSTDSAARALAHLMQPAIVMLSSTAFPKDVLNATGLLVASIFTVRTCNPWLMRTTCQCICNRVSQSVGLPITSMTPQRLDKLFSTVDDVLLVVCATDPRSVARSAAGSADNSCTALSKLFSEVTPNGCFALLKGFLAHLSTPIRDDVGSLGILLAEEDLDIVGDAPVTDGGVRHSVAVVHDIILPAAELYCSAVNEPETRFMAIQTVDSVIRHIASVLSLGQQLVFPSPTSEIRKRKEMPLTTCNIHPQVRAHLKAVCSPTKKLQETTNFATQLLMSLWDDGTQQISGALSDTYGEILRINEVLKRCESRTFNRGDNGSLKGVVDTAGTLYRILDVQSERRGKYHALLGLLSVMPLEDFLRVLQRYYDTPSLPSSSTAPSSAASLESFSRMLLSAASNHKIGSVAGDVFAKLARSLPAYNNPSSISASSSSSCSPVLQKESMSIGLTGEELLRIGMLLPLARGITDDGYVFIAANVSAAINISHITAHFVAPLVKLENAFLRHVLEAVLARGREAIQQTTTTTSTFSWERYNQGVVEVLSRSRSVGVDIMPYLTRYRGALQVLKSTTQSLNSDTRHTAMFLCVLGSKKVEALSVWQMEMMIEYLSLNMHLGGDWTACKKLLEMVRKWTRRLVVTYNSKSAIITKKEQKATVDTQGTDDAIAALGSTEYRELVLQHCEKLAAMFAWNIGTSVSRSSGLALERRVMAMLGYRILLDDLRSELPVSVWVTVRDKMCQGAIVSSLLVCLSDGWSQARSSARDLLVFFSQEVPSVVFSTSPSPSDDLAQSAYSDLLRSKTFRNAEGAVQRYLLYVARTPAAEEMAKHQPQAAAEQWFSRIRAGSNFVKERCTTITSLAGREVHHYIQENPLHGSISLCTELLRHTATYVGVTPTSSFAACCTQLLQCCGEVFRSCGALVGTDTVGSTPAAMSPGLVEQEVVDCRGHIYDRHDPEAEAVMRGVVNNIWLSLRVATTAVVAIMRLCSVDRIPVEVVRSVAYSLANTLLMTKHNGVMRCVRDALRAMMEVLVRSRDSACYRLPAEFLDYLLGPEGVTSGDVARMLRRSQGLPHAILAILEAEDAGVPLCLFPVAMRRLLDVAQGCAKGFSDEQSSASNEVLCSQRSNALNVMKFIFENRIFADRVVAYVEDAFSLATAGFNDASWYTRNSSLMLFSAVIHRFVGEHPSTGGAGVNTSLHDVAKRTPRCITYAYEELMRGVQTEAASTPTSAQTSTEVDYQGSVALFPILQLLSLLSPDPPHLVTKASHSEADDTVQIIEAVQQCSHSRSLMVRSASATALVCLVPIAALSETIHCTRDALLCTRESGQETAGGGGRSINSCHGALIQLLQFHSQYVGTLRRNWRQKKSSYATPAVARTVSAATAEVVLSAREALSRVAAVCPTVAGSLLTLLADIIYYAPQCGLEATRQRDVQTLTIDILAAYASQRSLLDRGSVMESAGLAVLLIVSQRMEGGDEEASKAWSPSDQQCLATILAGEASRLMTARGIHNLVSCMAVQLLYYSEEQPIFTSHCVVSQIVRVLAHQLNCDMPRLVLRSLSATLPEATPPVLGCVGWSQLVSHLRFAAASLVFHPEIQGDDEEQQILHQLFDTLMTLLKPREISAREMLHNADACSAAIEFITKYILTTKAKLSVGVTTILSHHAHSEKSHASRVAVAKAMHTLLPFLQKLSADSVSESVAHDPASLQLLFVLLRLLFDDTSEIRVEAAVVSSELIWGTTTTPRDQTSCILGIVLLLQRLHQRSAFSEADIHSVLSVDKDFYDAVWCHETAEAGNNKGDEAAAEVDDGSDSVGDNDSGGSDSDDDDVLFQKESANMFVEPTVLSQLISIIVAPSSTNSSSAHGTWPNSFPLYDELLQRAMKQDRTVVSIGAGSI